MKLQFAFGNPRKGKKKSRKTAKRKIVAKRRKKTKTKRTSVKSKKLKKVVKMAKHGKRRKKSRKNPEAALIRKNGKVIGREFSPLSAKEAEAVKNKVKEAFGRYKSAPEASKQKKKLRLALAKASKEAMSKLGKRDSFLKTVQRYAEDGAQITRYELAQKGAKSVAKKKKAKKKKSAKKAAKKVTAKKVTRTKKRKSSKKARRSKAKKHVAKKHVAKKAKRVKRKSRRKARRKARMVTHRHAASTRHLKKGTTFRFKAKSKKGKRKITVSGRVKINPYRRNPLKQLSAQSKKYLGMDAAELGALALGGVLVPVVNAGITKIPGVDKVVAKINEYVGPQAVGSVVPILVGAGLNAIAEHAYKGKGSEYLKLAGEGLAAAGIIGLAISLSQQHLTPMLGLAGVNYTPTLRGMGIMPTLSGMGDVRFTPSRNMGIMPTMGDIRYTPAMSGMGDGADFGAADYGGDGGYTQSHKMSRADFGADFSSDSEAEGLADEDNSYSSSMN